MSTENHQVNEIKRNVTDPAALRAIAADRDLPVTTRQAAERKLRKLQKSPTR
jgi:hypothetical protein